MVHVASIILAAGKGTRMKSRLPKVLHAVCGRPMLSHVISAATKAGVDRNVVVIGHEAAAVKEKIGTHVDWVYQKEQLGTGHAVMQAEPLLKDFPGTILVLCGDTPLITAETLTQMIGAHRQGGQAATVLTALLDNPAGYGRIMRNEMGTVEGIVEHKDASPEQLQIKEINTGIYSFDGPKLFAGLKKISPANAQGEYYLTDVLAVLRESGECIGAVVAAEPQEMMGINNRVQLAEAENLMRLRTLKGLMLEGITLIDPQSTYIDTDVVIGRDTVIYPGTFIEGHCRIGENCRIGPDTRIRDTDVGDEVTIQNSIILDSKVGNHANIGPFAYIRPDTILAEDVKVGDFVEIKKSFIGKGSKVPHLSYVGDAEIGEKVNVGAGTITCNYDGSVKSKTMIGDHAFIGSNTNLVAPVEVGKAAVIAAGSTITKDVPEGSLAVERGKQEVIPGWVARKSKKK